MFFQKWNELVQISKSGSGFLSTQRALLSAIDTFIQRSNLVTKAAPHIRDATDLKRMMIIVVFALLPSTVFGIWNTGKNCYKSIGLSDCSNIDAMVEGAAHVLPLIILSYAVGGLCEAIFAQAKGHEIAEGFLVTGLLYPLTCPPTIPWWMFAIGIVFGVIIGKEVFGGTGMNIMNPALLSRAFLFFAYPGQMSGDDVWVKKPYYENLEGTIVPCSWTTIDKSLILSFINSDNVSAVSGQTPLALAATLSSENFADNINNGINKVYPWSDMFFGSIPGSIGETSSLMCIIGATIIVTTGVASWRTMISVLFGAFLATSVLSLLNPSASSDLTNVSLFNHFIMGSFAFGTVFMATDPVSSPLHKTSQYIYGTMIGFICIVVRVLNPAFPEGMMLSILFVNIFSPLIDHYVTTSKVQRRQRRNYSA